MLCAVVDVVCCCEVLAVCICLMSLFDVVAGCRWWHLVCWLLVLFVGVCHFVSVFDVCCLLAVLLASRC